ncbi:1-phosphofructokinase [Listeria sp. PSOL-1]|uniref:1-phosphofructokinase n=1 Tax=Listeria sp. PSOL-1 TaxID=1844999 RepID=UPI0013D82390|nr:1-phosphofructokinase [Listeria sp. PSOL-1]
MIYTITLNPSIDYIVEVEHLELGRLNRMKRDYKLPGGKGINVSRVLNQLDVKTNATGFLGGFTGDFIEKWLNNEGIGSSFTKISDDTRINIKLKDEAETEINGLGPTISEAEIANFFSQLNKIEASDTVILSGSIPPSLGNHFYERIIDLCIRKGAEFMIDTTGDELIHAIAKKPLLIKPNHHELEELFQVTFNTMEEIVPYGKKCLELGAKHVIVSMAQDGALLFTDEAVYFAKPIIGQVKNSVGAGDSMIAGFIGTLCNTNDPIEAFKMGVATGTATAFSTDLATAKQIRALIPLVDVNKL